jgi:hypothetical protein
MLVRITGVLVALLAVFQLHLAVDGPTKWSDTRATRMSVGPYRIGIPSGWRDARELAIDELRDHATAHSATTLVPDDMPARLDEVQIAWEPALPCTGATIHVGDETGCMTTFTRDGRPGEVIAIHHGDRDLVFVADGQAAIAACDEVLSKVVAPPAIPAGAQPNS